MKIVFIVGCKFPYGDASSVRAMNLCKVFKEAGHDIHVISDFPSEKAAGNVDICSYECHRLGSVPL